MQGSKMSMKKRNARRFMKCSTAFIIMMFMLVQIFPSYVLAASSGDVTGSFAAKAAPTVDSVAVKTAAATATVAGANVTDANALLLNFSGASVLSFTLNGTTIVLNGGAGTYATIGAVATSIQSQLTSATNTTVAATDSGADGHIILTGAANQNIVITAGSGTISSIGLTAGTTNATTGNAASFSPDSTYNIEVTITEPDGLGSVSGGLSNIVTKIWYDSVGTNNVQAYYDLQTTASTTQCAIITWNRATNTATLNSGTGSSWSLGTSTLPSAANLADASVITHTFIFPVKIGKIAHITANPARWQIAAKATDADSASDYDCLAVPLAMNWYGEISLPADTKADWGRVDAGLDWADTAAKLSVAGMELLSNGAYYERTKASSIWTDNAATPTTVTRTVAAGAANQFQVVGDNASTYAVGTAKVIPIDGTTTIALNGVAYTANTTYTTTKVDNYLYLKLNATFPAGKIFTGTITYLISDVA